MEESYGNLDTVEQFREKELENIGDCSEEINENLDALQTQYNEALEKIAEQSAAIKELQGRLIDYEYLSQRNLRG